MSGFKSSVVCVLVMSAWMSPAGRPVDVVVAPDGSLLISDDEGSRIYRLSHRG